MRERNRVVVGFIIARRSFGANLVSLGVSQEEEEEAKEGDISRPL